MSNVGPFIEGSIRTESVIVHCLRIGVKMYEFSYVLDENESVLSQSNFPPHFCVRIMRNRRTDGFFFKMLKQFMPRSNSEPLVNPGTIVAKKMGKLTEGV